jgi:hypothetical protein
MAGASWQTFWRGLGIIEIISFRSRINAWNWKRKHDIGALVGAVAGLIAVASSFNERKETQSNPKLPPLWCYSCWVCLPFAPVGDLGGSSS